jgi:hypothetical protein
MDMYSKCEFSGIKVLSILTIDMILKGYGNARVSIQGGDEPISYSLIAGGTFILIGIYLVNNNFKKEVVGNTSYPLKKRIYIRNYIKERLKVENKTWKDYFYEIIKALSLYK